MPWRAHIPVLLLVLWAGWPAAGRAQDPPIRFRLGAEETAIRPGGTLVLTVVARIPRGWHLYGLRQPAGGPLPTAVEVGPDPPFTLGGPVTASRPRSEFDPNFGVMVEWHDDSASFRVPVQAARTALPGPHETVLLVSYQRCNDRICLPLTTDTLRAPLTVAGAPVPQATSSPPAPGAPPGSGRSGAAGRARSPDPALGPSRSEVTPETRAGQPGAPAPPVSSGQAGAPAPVSVPGQADVPAAGATPVPGPPPGAQAGVVLRYLLLGGFIVLLLLVLLALLMVRGYRSRRG